MISALQEVCCARLPLHALGALAGIRDLLGVTVALCEDRAWVCWEPGDERVLQAVMPIRGVELYRSHEGQWYRQGSRLPSCDIPKQADFRPLSRVLTPATFKAVPSLKEAFEPVVWKLMPDTRPRPCTAVCIGVKDLARWADKVPSARLQAIRASRLHDRVLLLGARLPELGCSARYWGTSVLLPLGHRLEPDLPFAAVRQSLNVNEDELLIVSADGMEVIPLAAFCPLTRAQIRLAGEEVAQ